MIIGAAFGKIVDGLVNDILMPITGIAGKADFCNYFISLFSNVTAINLADARKQGGVFAYGDFITLVINFFILRSRLFFIIQLLFVIQLFQRLTKKAETAPAAPPPPSQEVVLLTEIRDQPSAPEPVGFCSPKSYSG